MSTARERFNEVLKAQSGQGANYTRYNNTINKITTYEELYALGQECIKEGEGLPNGMYLFVKEDSSKFWGKYNELKEVLPHSDPSGEKEKAHKEYKEMIEEFNTVAKLRLLNSTIFDDEKPSNKKELFKLSKIKIAELEKSA